MNCAGSTALERGMPDTSSEHADEGTAAHFLASECLKDGATRHPAEFKGQSILVPPHGDACFADPEANEPTPGRVFAVDDDMATHVQTYVSAVLSAAQGAEIDL